MSDIIRYDSVPPTHSLVRMTYTRYTALGTETDCRCFARFFYPVFVTDNRPFPYRFLG